MWKLTSDLTVTLAFSSTILAICTVMWILDAVGIGLVANADVIHWPTVFVQAAGYATVSGLLVDALRGMANSQGS
ncbi:MAG: hypothetical protein QNJ00_11860 [Woeseiaceae bacterium]|nr:hypothetical protein [Woeseiaceae bacterium]